MALMSYFLLGVLTLFVVAATLPLLSGAYWKARDEVVTGGWPAAVSIVVRSVLWLVLVLPVVGLIWLIGFFAAG